MKTEVGRAHHLRKPIVLFVCGFILASGAAAFAFTTTSGTGTGRAQAITLNAPGAGRASNPTTTSISLSWSSSSGLPSGAGYLVLRSAAPGGPYSKVSDGMCQQATTLVSSATSCTDTGLTPGTTYYYEVEAAYYVISTLWVSAPDSQFSATTQGSADLGTASQGPAITSANSTTFGAGNPGSFTVTTGGFSNPTITDASFSGCTPSALPGTVTFSDDHDGTATLAGSPTPTSSGSYTVCINVTDGTNTATQKFTLTVNQASASSGAPAITSANSTTFLVGTAGSFQVTASGTPAPTFSNTAFSGCSPSTLPSGVTFSHGGLLSGTPSANAAGTYTLCINAGNGVSPNGTQKLTLTIETERLVVSTPAVSGATSSTPNLGPLMVQRQSGSGAPIATGGALTVNLTSSPSNGATFGATQFSSAPLTTVTIPSGQSTATFWYGLTTTGTPTITVSASGYLSGTQLETITAAPAGLGVVIASGSTGVPTISCGTPSASYSCNVKGVGTSGKVVLSVAFWNASQGPVVYSATQASVVSESGSSLGRVTVNANASSSSPNTLTASVGTSTITFGPYVLTVNVSA